MDIKINDFIKVLVIVLLMAFGMISIAYGILFMFKTEYGGPQFPIPPYFILLLFAIGFVLGSVFFEKRDAEFPWSLVGGAIASIVATFLLTAIIGGLKFIQRFGITNPGLDALIYALSACIIVSLIILNLAAHKL